MLPADTQHSFRFCTTMMSLYDSDGFLGIQPDSDGTESGGLTSGADAPPQAASGGAPDYEWIAPYGMISRHSDPVVDSNGNPDSANAGLTLVMMEGGRGYCLPLTDPRTTAILPPIEKGSTWVYAANGISGLMIRGAGVNQGQVSLMTTTDGTTAGQTVGLRVWPDGFARTAPWGTEDFSNNGYHLVLPQAGCAFRMGAVGGLPGPAASLGSYASLTAASIGLKASIVKLGVPGPLGYSPVVVMNPGEIAWRAAVLAALQAIETALATATSVTTGGPLVLAGLPTAIAALSALAAIQPALTSVSASTVAS
jgi:hypothetical protein